MSIVNKILFGLGLSSIMLGIPLSQILANNYNFFTINNYFIEITILLLVIIIYIGFFYAKIKLKSKLYLILFNIIFFQIINIYIVKYTEYFFNDYSTSVKIITNLILIFFFLIISIIINNQILEKIIKYLSILFFFQLTLIIFYSTDFASNRYKNNLKTISDTNNVFMIIIDELSLDFITNENNEIKDEFINLKELSNNSSYYTNAYTSFDFTSKAMLSVLTFGDSLNNEIIKNKNHYFKDINLYNNNLYEELSKTHKINVFASYDYCHYHIRFIDYCISNINDESGLLNSVSSYLYFIYLYSSPRFVVNKLHNLNIINKDGSTKDYFKNEINLIDQYTSNIKLNSDEKNLYLLHTNITHQPWVLDKNGKINLENVIAKEDLIKNIDKLKKSYFETILFADKKLGEIFSFLKNKGIYENSLILIMSDHGVSFDKDIFLRMNGKANTQISKIPLIIKKPFQKKAEIINENVNIIDVGSTLVNILNKSDKKYPYSRNLLNYTFLNKVNIPFLSVKEEYDITGKIIYNKKIYCKNLNQQYELIKNENHNNIFDICIYK